MSLVSPEALRHCCPNSDLASFSKYYHTAPRPLREGGGAREEKRPTQVRLVPADLALVVVVVVAGV